MVADPHVSVIIPAYNAAKTIDSAIRSVLSQDYAGKVDLIVVDDGSTDKTGDIVRSFSNVFYVRQENAGPASARNRGAAESRGEFLFFTDSDCCAERSWVSKMMRGFDRANISVVAGSYGIVNAHSILARAIHQEIIFRHEALMPDYPKSFGSYNFAVRRSVFEAVGGFNVSYRRASGEDNDLSYKIIAGGGQIRFLKDARVGHYHQESFGRYFKEQFYHGFWRVKIYVDHPGMLSGDGYTFWKDMVELPLVGVLVATVFFPSYFIAVFLAFLVFELVFGWLMTRSLTDGFVSGVTMLFRSFARTAGFISGGVILLANKILIDKKK
ncbi:MAG: glycosyltransferase [Candidatus Omnitrophica bacterium]|nr:glycosyltransferase [Candidatus Omnitrophota bacterium]